MNNTLLINRIDPQEEFHKEKRIFFLLGKENIINKEVKIMEVLKNMSILENVDIVYKYNGVELSIKVKLIPEIIKNLSGNDIDIFSIFETYNPEL